MTIDQRKPGLAACLAISWLVIGCGPIDSLLGKEPNPSCRKPGCVPPDSSNTCASNADCEPPGVCDVMDSKQCVPCTPEQPAACSGTTPACGMDHMCRACTAHTDCALSSACLPDGSCAAEFDVAYVDPAGTDNTTCSRSMPCSTVKKALMAAKPYVKFHGTIDETVVVSKRAVTFLADPGAKLTHTAGGGDVLTVQNDVPSLAIYDLAIADIRDNTSVGLSVPVGAATQVSLTRVSISNNAGFGISIGNGSLTLVQSVISGNGRGGVSVNGDAKFAIVGNVFLVNGTATTARGALEVSTAEATTNRLEFNSFHGNAARSGVGAAIQCSAGQFTARNNIMFMNGTLNTFEQVGGNCGHAYSIAMPGTLPPGIGNLAADPRFKDTAQGDLHLLPGSPAIRAADPESNLTGLAERDIDGAARTRPATLGAYQMP